MDRELYRRRGRWIFYAQRARCYDSRNKSFKDYGKRGIRVEYSLAVFLIWYLNAIKAGRWKRPSVGRIDHEKGYRLDNIEMQEVSTNISERNERHGNPGKKHRGVVAFVGLKHRKFRSKVEAAQYYGLCEKTIYNHCQGRTKSPWKFGPNAGRSVRFQWAS